MVYKLCNEPLSTPISNLFNHIIDSGIYPDILKIARITPVFKSGAKTAVANYRPISCLSFLNKIIEKLLYTRLYSYLETNNLLSPHQFGFRPKYSTEIAINYFLQNVFNSNNNNEYFGAVFLDLSRAFDSIDHDILLALEHLHLSLTMLLTA